LSSDVTIAYFDSSGIVKLLIPGEVGVGIASAAISDAPSIATSVVAHAECRAALAAALRAARLDPARLHGAVEILETLWVTMIRVVVTIELAQQAGELAERHRLRGFDAIHLASALSLGAEATMVSWDNDLARAAHDAGLATVPPWR
jgi:predicted nucleic acid-binding protein